MKVFRYILAFFLLISTSGLIATFKLTIKNQTTRKLFLSLYKLNFATDFYDIESIESFLSLSLQRDKEKIIYITDNKPLLLKCLFSLKKERITTYSLIVNKNLIYPLNEVFFTNFERYAFSGIPNLGGEIFLKINNEDFGPREAEFVSSELVSLFVPLIEENLPRLKY